MTTRAWFRLHRLLVHADQIPGVDGMSLDRLVTKVLTHQPLDLVESLGPVKLIFGREEWEHHENALTLVKMRLELAIREIDRELQRRRSIEGLDPRPDYEAAITADPQDFWKGQQG